MDLSLDESQQILVDTFAEMLEKECPTTLVRDCEATGFSPELWDRFGELGANVMGLPEAVGGLEMSLLDLGLVATRAGSALAPVPFLEIAAAGRLLAGLDASDPLLGEIAEGRPSVSIVLPRPHAVRGTSQTSGGRALVPFGAVADHVVALVGDELVVVSDPGKRRSEGIQEVGAGAIAHWDLSPGEGVRSLASGEAARAAMDRANAEWKLLAGFWLVGIAQRALEIGSDYARERIQFGVPIGGFQAIAHPLAECAIRTDGAELLAWEAAWADVEEPEQFGALASMAFVWGAQTALRTADVSLHTHGGYGFSTEYDIQLFYRRARSLASLAGGSREELMRVAELRYGVGTQGGA